MLLFIGISSFLGKNFQKFYPGQYMGAFYPEIAGNRPDNLIIERLDIREKKDVDGLFKKYSFDSVVLAAALIYSKNKDGFRKVNVDGVKNVVEAMKESGVKKIIYISTAVLEAGMELWGEYGRTKKMAEDLIKNSGLEYVILRPAEIYGEYEKEGIGKLIKWIKKYSFFPLIGGGRNMLSPVRAEDVCSIVIKCLETESHDNKTFLLCGGEKISFKNLALKIGQHFNKKICFIPIPAFLFSLIMNCWPFIDKDQMKRAVNTRAFDSSSAEAEFGFKFKEIDFSYLDKPL